MKRIILAILTLAVIFSSLPAFSQENPEVIKLKNQIIDIQNKSKLGFQNFTLCDKVLGFGMYIPTASATAKKGGSLLIYYEPVNLFTKRSDNKYENWYMQDMIIMSGDEKTEIFKKEDALNQHVTGKNPVFDHYVTNTMDLGNLPEGQYVYKAVLKDKLSGQTAIGKFKFEIK